MKIRRAEAPVRLEKNLVLTGRYLTGANRMFFFTVANYLLSSLTFAPYLFRIMKILVMSLTFVVRIFYPIVVKLVREVSTMLALLVGILRRF